MKSPSRGNDRGNDSPMPRAKGRSVVFKESKVSEAPQGADWIQTEAIKQADPAWVVGLTSRMTSSSRPRKSLMRICF